jgi:hypothetical protein
MYPDKVSVIMSSTVFTDENEKIRIAFNDLGYIPKEGLKIKEVFHAGGYYPSSTSIVCSI